MSDNDTDRTATDGTRNQGPEYRFFGWIRDFGLVRSDDRWLAGVCGGISRRTGLDPLIIRGIALVVALLGGPIFLAYAVGWALLPDTAGRIHLERLLRGVFDPAIVAICVLVVLTFMPFARGIWWQGPPLWWGMPDWLETTLRTGWALALVAGIVWLIVVLARRVPHRGESEGCVSGSERPGEGRNDFWTSPIDPQATASVASEPGGWESGRDERDRADDRHRRQRERIAEYHARQAERAAGWRDRRPGAAFVAIGLGIAIVAGALASLPFLQAGQSHIALVVGIGVALGVVAIATIIAGLRGRESGGLGFFGFVGVIALLVTGILPAGTSLSAFGGTTWHVASNDVGSSRSFAMLAGGQTLDLSELSADDTGGDVDVWLGFGSTDILLPEDVPVRVKVSGLVTGLSDDGAGSSADDHGGMFFATSVENAAARGAPASEVTTVRVMTFMGSVTVDER